MLGDPKGSHSKIAIKVCYVKSMGIKVMTQQFCQSTWSFRTSSAKNPQTHYNDNYNEQVYLYSLRVVTKMYNTRMS